MENYYSSTYGDRMADIYDEIQGDRDTKSTVEFLASLATGRVLELGIGTGRVAIPLANKGIELHGIDTSVHMLEQLRAKSGGEKIFSVLGDMETMPVEGCYSLIYAAFGTFFCLPSQDAQIKCFNNVAEHLSKEGVFVIECSIPDFSAFTRNQNVRVSNISMERVIVTSTEHDPVSQRTMTQHLLATQEGIRLLPVYIRYAWPSELDLMAKIAGFELKERWGDWYRSPFTANSTRHISVYGRP